MEQPLRILAHTMAFVSIAILEGDIGSRDG